MQYNRILLKLSGESLMGEQKYGIDTRCLESYARQIHEIAEMGIQIGIVIGGGNIFRGLSGTNKGFDRVKGDSMGMLATVINSLALSSALDNEGCKNKVLTAIRMEPIGEFYSKAKAMEYLKSGHVTIISGVREILTSRQTRPVVYGQSKSRQMPCLKGPAWTESTRQIRKRTRQQRNLTRSRMMKYTTGDLKSWI